MHKVSPKPFWLNKKINLNGCWDMKNMLRGLRLNTVCEQSLCPNISECFESKVVTFMILGNACTRACRFCAVTKEIPEMIDLKEPIRIKEAVRQLELNYVVITSPTRDDLADGGAAIFCQIIQEILSLSYDIEVEALIPDFKGNVASVKLLATSGAGVIAHNLETVPSLYRKVRAGADYKRSLYVLKTAKEQNRKIFTKSGIMLGLGESDKEVLRVMRDLRSIDCDFLTLGQYLPPSLKHYPLKEYAHPERFSYLRSQALKLGFKDVKSSPYTRSSYKAHSFI